MSRTQRKIRRFRRGSIYQLEIVEGDDTKAKYHKGTRNKKKMKPFTKKSGDMKFEAVNYTGTAPTKQDKLITKNANRSRKKAYRQQLKKELKDAFKDIQGY